MIKQGVYLIGESGLINSNTGAGNHISVGIKFLSESFDIITISPEIFVQTKKEISNNVSEKLIYDTNKFRGFIRNFRKILINLLQLSKYYKVIKSSTPDFIYERASFLNINGFVISKLLNIPIFYEVNGIMHQDHKNYYDFYGGTFLEIMEKYIYSHSSYVFFIGSYGDYYKLNSDNWINTENGINHIKLQTVSNIDNIIVRDKKIKIAFVGTIMKHHYFGDLLKVLNKMNNIEIHLIGNNNSNEYLGENVIYHGYVNDDELNRILNNIDIGIIPPLLKRQYSSSMKLYNYGLNNCLVIAPNIYNLKYWFDDSEIVFYDNNSSLDFEKKLLYIIHNIENLKIKSENLNKRVIDDFNWSKIFKEKVNIIKSMLN